MTRRVVWLFVLLSNVALWAQSSAVSISGVVIDDEGKPMRRVSVYFESDARANRIAITDDQGQFVVTGIPAARYTIRAEKGGYPPVNYGAKRPGRPGAGLLVKDGERVENITLRMARGAVITGTVFDDKGRPLPGASVTAFVLRTNLNGDVDISPVVRSGSSFPVTDDRGVFRFYGLAAGEYIVGTTPFFYGLNDAVRVPTDAEIRDAFGLSQTRATRAISTEPKPTSPAAPPLVNYAPVYFPDVSDPMTATRVKVEAGEERRGVDLHLVLQATASISGEVIGGDADAAEVEMQLARIVTTAGATVTQMSAQTSRAFTYRSLPPGEYTLTARVRQTPVQYAEASVSLNGRDVAGLRVSLQPAMTLSGRLAFQGAALPPPDAGRVAVMFSPVRTSDRSITNSVQIRPDFSFGADDVIPGRTRIGATLRDVPKPGAPTWTLASVMYGDRDVTDLPVQIAAGDTIPPVTITFTDTPSELSGRLITAEGKPGTDYFVVALASDERYWVWSSRRIKSTRPDANGHYAFPGLPPGTYRVAATTDLEQGDLQSLTFLRELIRTSAEVTVGAGEKKVFDLKLGGT